MEISILHVEDDPLIVSMVQLAFKRFGFAGSIISTDMVCKAIDLLADRARDREPIDLILVDMHLPDGLGLDVVRAVRKDPFWHLTPVLVLSSEMDPHVITEAYALGVNCYIPKGRNTPLKDLQSLYQCWVETALLPSSGGVIERGEEVVARAVNLRARTSGVYLRMAELSAVHPEEADFWLERSLSEANLSNLLALFSRKIKEKDLPPGLIDRLATMQIQVEDALNTVEKRLEDVACGKSRCFADCSIHLASVVDEEIVAEVFGCLFPKNPAVTTALKRRAAEHFRELARHALESMPDSGLREQAEQLRDWAARMATATLPILGD